MTGGRFPRDFAVKNACTYLQKNQVSNGSF